jgi:phage antirepressor YoqD-like protein
MQLSYEIVSDALEKTGSIRKAAKFLGISRNSINWWMARNGYRIKCEVKAYLVKADLGK